MLRSPHILPFYQAVFCLFDPTSAPPPHPPISPSTHPNSNIATPDASVVNLSTQTTSLQSTPINVSNMCDTDNDVDPDINRNDIPNDTLLNAYDQHPNQDNLLLNPIPTEPGASVLSPQQQNPRHIVPTTIAQAKEAVRLALLDNSTCKAVLKTLKVSGAQNAKVATKLAVIAVKLTQRGLSVKSVLDIVERLEDEGEGISHELQSLRQTAVKIVRATDGKENITWLRGDVPEFEDGEVLVGKPEAEQSEALQTNQSREPDFEASEYCRLLHVLADSRMTIARAQLMEPRTREELDAEPFDPWTDHIAPLFNDETFKPTAITTISGGVALADIASLQPSIRIYERPAGVLKRKFGEFKSAYGTCLSKYESSGQGDPDGFVSFANARTYIIYAFVSSNKIHYYNLLPRGLYKVMLKERKVLEAVYLQQENICMDMGENENEKSKKLV